MRAAWQTSVPARVAEQWTDTQGRRVGTMTSTDHALPIGNDEVTTGEWIEVRAPYDDALLGRVPACGTSEVANAVAAARAVHEAGPLAAWKRAEILDTAARLLSERVESFARII